MTGGFIVREELGGTLEATVEQGEGREVKLSVTLSPEEVDSAVDKAYASFGAKMKVPGFRKGKVPKPVVDNYVGKAAVLAEATEDLVSRAYIDAVESKALLPLEQPEVDELDRLEEHQEYTFSATLRVRPEMSLTSADDFKVQAPPAEPTDEEIDAQIENLRDRFATLEEVTDRGIQQEGDFALISFEGAVDGKPYEGGRVDKYLYEMGMGTMPPEFEEALVGAKPGDKVHAEFTIPETSAVPDYVGKTATFDIEVHEVKKKVLPERDDEFAKSVGGFDDLAQMRDDIRKKMEQVKQGNRINQIEAEAREELTSRLEGEVPEDLVEARRAEMMEDFFGKLREQGIELDTYVEATGVPMEKIESDIAEQAGVRIRNELALEALFRARGLELTEEDLAVEFDRMAQYAERDAKEVRQNLTNAGMMPTIRMELMRRKAVRWLVENVEVEDKAPESTEAGEAEAAPKKKTRKKKEATGEEDE